MDGPEDRLAAAFKAFLRERFDQSKTARDLAVELAHWILREAAEAQASTEPMRAAPDRPTTPPEHRAMVPLAIGDSVLHIEVPGTPSEVEAAAKASQRSTEPDASRADARPPDTATVDIDLALVTRRARLKAQSCHLCIERRTHESDPLTEQPLTERMNQMITQAKAMPNCFLWAFTRDRPQPDDETLRSIAGCYDALAEAAALCHRAVEPGSLLSSSEVQRTFELLAEASSALRVALGSTWITREDWDQGDTHRWLRRLALERKAFIARHMQLDDPADPLRAPGVLADVASLSALLREREASARQAGSLFNRIRYHAGKLPETGIGDANDLARINDSAAALAGLGLSPTDPRLSEIRRVLRPSAFPPDGPLHPLLAGPSGNSPPPSGPSTPDRDDDRPAPAWSDRVLQARALLRGGSIVIVGGEPRQDAIRRIADAFSAATVDWVGLTEHGTGEPMRAPISRPATRLVVVLIKLCGHLHAAEARQYARNAGKPCVSLPAGYSPEQIAEQVLGQAAEQLAQA